MHAKTAIEGLDLLENPFEPSTKTLSKVYKL